MSPWHIHSADHLRSCVRNAEFVVININDVVGAPSVSRTQSLSLRNSKLTSEIDSDGGGGGGNIFVTTGRKTGIREKEGEKRTGGRGATRTRRVVRKRGENTRNETSERRRSSQSYLNLFTATARPRKSSCSRHLPGYLPHPSHITEI